MSAPEKPVIHDVTVEWTGNKARSFFPGFALSIKGDNILALTEPDDAESYILIPLSSGNVRYADVRRKQEEEQ